MALPNFVEGTLTWAKGHRAQAAAMAAGLLVVLVFMFSGGGDSGLDGPGEETGADMFGAGALPEDVTTVKAMSEMQARMESLSLTLARQQELHERLVREVESQGRELRMELESQERARTQEMEQALSRAIDMARDSAVPGGEAGILLPPPTPKLRILRPGAGGVTAEAPAPSAAVPAEPAPGPWVRLPLGSVVTGELMTGAFATKVRGDALPVLVQLRSAYSGPNDSEIPLEDCLLIGKATADIASVRARVEAVNLSCVLPDGTAFERPVRGYFTGEDGTLGVPGRWEFRSGRWLGNLLSAMGTVAAGVYADIEIAEALQGADILGSISASETTDRIQEFFLQRAEEILPVVWVESGTPVYVVMLEGLTIEGLAADVHYPVATSVLD